MAVGFRLSTKAHVVVAKPRQNPHDRLGRSGSGAVLRLDLHLLSAPWLWFFYTYVYKKHSASFERCAAFDCLASYMPAAAILSQRCRSLSAVLLFDGGAGGVEGFCLQGGGITDDGLHVLEIGCV